MSAVENLKAEVRHLLKDNLRLSAEVKELQALKKLVGDIVQQHDGPHLREMLKEMLE